MPKSLRILPRLAIKRSAGECPLLEGNKEEWIVCCSQRFFPLAKRISGDDSLAEDALQVSWIKILQAVNHTYFKGPKACPWVSRIVANAAQGYSPPALSTRGSPAFRSARSQSNPRSSGPGKRTPGPAAGDRFSPPGHLSSSCRVASVPGSFHPPDGTTSPCLPLECRHPAESSGSNAPAAHRRPRANRPAQRLQDQRIDPRLEAAPI